MKPKSVSAPGRGRPPKQKIIKQEIEETVNVADFTGEAYQDAQNAKPSVEIASCISYQKFRYSGENRPGKKYQEKDFMELKLTNLGEKVVRVVIICTDADNKELIHPNGLVGKDCHDGIYDKEYGITKQNQIIKIPYLRTERIKTKKNEHSKIRDILKSRAEHLPSPYRERCESQCTDQYTFNRKFDTTKVCLGVIVTVRSHFQGAVNGSLHAISHVVHNASEKTSLGILKLSTNVFEPSKGGYVDVFTTEDGPAIENDKYFLFMTYETLEGGLLWESEKFSPSKHDILYKRIISYKIPPFNYNTDIAEDVEALLHLECPQSNQHCECPVVYSPNVDELMFYHTTGTKRSFTEELDDIKPPKRLRTGDDQNSNVKAVLKESLKRREDNRNRLPPAVQIIHKSDDGALVRRTDAINQDTSSVVYSHEHSSHSSNGETDQEYDNLKVLAAAYSNSVPSDTVLIITNDGPEDIENTIKKAVSDFEKPSPKGRENNRQPMIIIDPSSQKLNESKAASSSSIRDKFGALFMGMENRQVTISPNSNASEAETKTPKEASGKISRFDENQLVTVQPELRVSQPVVTNKPSTPLVLVKRAHKTDSPWAVGSDEESDEALNIFNELKNVSRKTSDEYQVNLIKDRSIHVEGKRISVLSSKGEAMRRLIVTKEQENTAKEDNVHLDFSEFQLPSELNLSSEIISNLNIVKEVSSELQS